MIGRVERLTPAEPLQGPFSHWHQRVISNKMDRLSIVLVQSWITRHSQTFGKRLGLLK